MFSMYAASSSGRVTSVSYTHLDVYKRQYIDRLDKLSEGIGGQLRESTVPLYPLNKLLYILCLLFLFMYLLLQTLDVYKRQVYVPLHGVFELT